MALTNKLSAIGDAIRGKTGKTDLLTLDQMPTEINSISVGSAATIESLTITSNGTYNAPDGVDGYSPITVNVPQDGAPTAEELTLTGTLRYTFGNNNLNWLINKYGNQITTKELGDCDYMFINSNLLTEIPFELNFKQTSSVRIMSMFGGCQKLTTIPKITNCQATDLSNIFTSCSHIRHFPEDLESYFNWTAMDTSTSTSYARSNTFSGCYSMRSFPMGFLNHAAKKITRGTYSIYHNGFQNCHALDEIIGLPVLYTSDYTTWTSNAFGSTFYNCYRLKNMIFATNEDGTPYIVNWKAQTIDLTTAGFSTNDGYITGYNSGITEDKGVTDDASYQALKNDPDWFTSSKAGNYCPWQYSRYNHDSAVATINSLPDASAYLATQSGATNTIKFRGEAGSATDGGAINTLTEEEIAVATAKGWTVTLT